MSSLWLLIKPTLFTAGVCGTCFSGAAIIHHENKKRPFPTLTLTEWIDQQRQKSSVMSKKYLKFRQQINAWKNQLSTGEKIAAGTIFINSLVLLGWRFNGLRPVMQRYFLSQTKPIMKTNGNQAIALSPMILSCFSHSTPIHFFFNMYCLYSFSNVATALLGPEQLIGLFISAGAVSSLASIANRMITRTTIPSLGASGAILGVVAYICMVRPDSELLLLLVPIAAGNAIKVLMVVDTVGLLARWRYIDHAAHLGGSLFGVWYASQGEKLYYQHRRQVVDLWLKIKSSFD